jgi:hypothetical protein
MEKIVLYFAQGESAHPLPGEWDKLKELEKFLDIPGTTIRIFGHASSEGTAKKNQLLSEDRAETVQSYLLAMGARLDRITRKSFGESKLAVSETGSGQQLEKARAKNRRVEIEYEPGKVPSPEQAYIDKYRERLKKNIANGEQRVRRLEEAERRQKAHPKTNPLCLIEAQRMLDAAREQLRRDNEALDLLTADEALLGDPKKVWKELISNRSAVHAGRISYFRSLLTQARQRLEEAGKKQLAAKDPEEKKFWNEVTAEYKKIIKDLEVELQWLLKEQESAVPV